MRRIFRFARFDLATDPTLRVFVRGSVGGFLFSATASGLAFLVSLLLARELGPSRYGAYAYAVSWTMLLGVFADFGLGRLVVRNVATYHAREQWPLVRGQLTWALVSSLVASLITALLGLLALLWLRRSIAPEMFAPLLVASLILPLSGLLRASQAALRGLQRLLSGQVAEIVVQPGAMLLLVAGATLLAPAALDPAAAVGLHLASLGVALLAGAWLLRRHLPGGATKAASSWRHDEWIRGAVYLMLIGGLHILNSRIDIVMLGSLATAKETGVYTICARGADLAMFLALPVHTALMPLAAKLHAAARLAELQLVAARSARAIFVLSFPLVAVLATFGDRFLLLYGEDYAVGARALAILCLGKLALLAAGPAALLLTMTGFERSAALGVGASAALNIVLNSFTIPALGMEGAAVATAISAVTLAGFMTLLVRRNLAIRPDILGRRRSAPGD